MKKQKLFKFDDEILDKLIAISDYELRSHNNTVEAMIAEKFRQLGLEIKKAKKAVKKKHDQYSEQFEEFYQLYQNKKSKAKAWEAWQKINPDDDLHESILIALQQQIHERSLFTKHGAWIASWKLPATWLNQRCWEDEIYTEKEIIEMAKEQNPNSKTEVGDTPKRSENAIRISELRSRERELQQDIQAFLAMGKDDALDSATKQLSAVRAELSKLGVSDERR